MGIFQNADPLVLRALVLIPYGAVVAFYVLWVVNIHLDGAMGLVTCVVVCVLMTAVFMFFAGVNLPILPWQGAEDIRLRLSSWLLLGLVSVTPWLLRAFHRATDISILRASNVRAVQRALDDIEVNPTNPAPHVALADIYERQGRLDEAVKQLEVALEKAPTMPTARARLDKLRARQGGLTRLRKQPTREPAREPTEKG